MALMEFLTKNKINTTTMFDLASCGSTELAQYLIDKNPRVKYRTTDYNSTTTATLKVTFASPTVLSHILIQNHNLKSFKVYQTTTAYMINTTTNSATSTYLSFASVTVSAITIEMTDTIAGHAEKEIGELVFTERELQFERNPSINNFTPKIFRKQIRHEMPDGGVSLYNIRDKYRAMIGLSYITQAFHDSLLDVFNTAQPVIFCPFPTTTAWDGTAPEVVWSGDFNFKYGANVKDSGFSGNMTLEETVSG